MHSCGSGFFDLILCILIVSIFLHVVLDCPFSLLDSLFPYHMKYLLSYVIYSVIYYMLGIYYYIIYILVHIHIVYSIYYMYT